MKTIALFRAHLNRSLFPDAPEEQPASKGGYLLLLFGLLTLAILLQLLRLSWSTSLHSIWAEDGPIFLQGALTHSLGDSLISVYANYLVVVPRLIGEAATYVPLRDAPAAISILSAGMVALSGFVVWQASAAHIRNPYLRGMLALLTILVPVGSLESIDSASYVSWYMLFATFWVLLWRPRTMWAAALASLFVFAAALSNPGVWFFIPLAALRGLAARDRRDIAIVSSFALGAAIQMPVLALNHEPAVEPLWTQDIWTIYLQRVLDGAAFGLRLGGHAWTTLGWPLLITLLLCAAAGLFAGIKRSSAPGRYLAAVAIPTSLLMFIVSVYQRAVGAQMIWPADRSFGDGGRYAIVPALLLVSVALSLIDSSARHDPRWRQRRLSPAGFVAVGLMAIAITTSFPAGNLAGRGEPPWDAALNNAALTCATGHPTNVAIPTSPPGFGVEISCDRIVSGADAGAARR
jgi:hypothetical protein